MKLEPESASLTVGGQSAISDQQWANLEVVFKDTDVDHSYTTTLRILVPKRPDATLRELQDAARKAAIPLLREAADLLERETLEALEQQEADRHAAEAAHLREKFGASE